MATLEKAIELAVKHHKGQTDKAGEPYILHPLRVMFKMSDNSTRIIAVLHDIIEDTEVSLDDLREMDFVFYIVDAIEKLTKRKGETYNQFINRVLKDPFATQVKLGDLEDNMDRSRLREVTAKDEKRLKKYKKAYQKIKDHLERTKFCSVCGDPALYCKCIEDIEF